MLSGPLTISARSIRRRRNRKSRAVSAASAPATATQPERKPELYLIYCGQSPPGDGWQIEGSVFRASDDICLARTTLSRSRIYHAIKRQIRSSARLLVAPLSGDPKFMGMARGTLAWLRRTENTSEGGPLGPRKLIDR